MAEETRDIESPTVQLINGAPTGTAEDDDVSQAFGTGTAHLTPTRVFHHRMRGPFITIESGPLRQTTLEGLYVSATDISTSLSSATILLKEGIDYLDAIIKLIDDEEMLGAHDTLMLFRRLLPELYCCRDLGEGFEEIVRSVNMAAENIGDGNLDREQAVAIRFILRILQREPFIKYDAALDRVIQLDQVGLVVDSLGVIEIIDIIENVQEND